MTRARTLAGALPASSGDQESTQAPASDGPKSLNFLSTTGEAQPLDLESDDQRFYVAPAVRVRRLSPTAIIPRYATAGAAAFDLHADGLGDGVPPRPMPGTPVDIGTGLAFAVPPGYVMLVFSRSGHAWRHDVRLANCVGVIDPDYRGEVRIKLAADSMRDGLRIRQGDRIAQALIVAAPRLGGLVEVDQLDETERGEGGFGSTGSGA